ncbi:hypothetical protein SAMD00019534_120270 [Acytostelium subglobosum LB1]|uniref:hypothetical protein n=1 Tax=Acytostelium subglobosum LB1 TaxID=1410327 RepID=UPI000644EB79|nr:hypothetical protein SAMD00019534_120270 [Acytostelium subglobosum LB1]GAM28851.1 hypothetical protein SAMD00019534_120270 [Acytostelium subglobosum LB1]|eukprot:XP_012748223.1 hypothetical protein SAMD00019534_120270 [Acytostelium subglobosum LB1]
MITLVPNTKYYLFNGSKILLGSTVSSMLTFTITPRPESQPTSIDTDVLAANFAPVSPAKQSPPKPVLLPPQSQTIIPEQQQPQAQPQSQKRKLDEEEQYDDDDDGPPPPPSRTSGLDHDPFSHTAHSSDSTVDTFVHKKPKTDHTPPAVTAVPAAAPSPAVSAPQDITSVNSDDNVDVNVNKEPSQQASTSPPVQSMAAQSSIDSLEHDIDSYFTTTTTTAMADDQTIVAQDGSDKTTGIGTDTTKEMVAESQPASKPVSVAQTKSPEVEEKESNVTTSSSPPPPPPNSSPTSVPQPPPPAPQQQSPLPPTEVVPEEESDEQQVTSPSPPQPQQQQEPPQQQDTEMDMDEPIESPIQSSPPSSKQSTPTPTPTSTKKKTPAKRASRATKSTPTTPTKSEVTDDDGSVVEDISVLVDAPVSSNEEQPTETPKKGTRAAASAKKTPVKAPSKSPAKKRAAKTAAKTSDAEVDQSAISPHKHPKIIFSGVEEKTINTLTKIVHKLGGEVVDNVEECTHLISDKLIRTVKILLAIANGKEMVGIQWLKDCGKAGHFLKEDEYMLSDANAEKEWKFELRQSLEHARNIINNNSNLKKPLDGLSFLVMEHSAPPKDVIQDLIKAGGGHEVDASAITADSDTIIIASEKDRRQLKSFLDIGATVHTGELLLLATLRQKIDLNECRLNIP